MMGQAGGAGARAFFMRAIYLLSRVSTKSSLDTKAAAETNHPIETK